MRIFLQVPEGLKTEVLKMAAKIEKQGNEVIISCEPCYGACDIRTDEAKRLGCGKIMHYGHSKFMDSEFPVEYFPAEHDDIEIPEFEMQHENIGLVTTIQHLKCMEKIKQILEKKGKNVFIGGQILGCDLSNAKAIENKVDCFLFFGSGRFHAIGLALSTSKPVFVLDIEKRILKKTDADIFIRQKIAAQELARGSKKIGILVSTKPGQCKIESAANIRNILKEKGIESFILSMDEIKPEKLEGFELDAYINTACPRIAIENRTEFKKPILNTDEAMEIFK